MCQNLLITVLVFSLSPLWAIEPPALSAPIVLVGDGKTGTILYEHGADKRIAPASLAKVMTLYLTAERINEGMIDPLSTITVGPEGAAASMLPNSSVMGLQINDEVTISTLMKATAILSAGDAAYNLAAIHSGVVPTFIENMNRTAHRLGMFDTHFVDPDGWSDASLTTARDQFTLARAYIKNYPEMLHDVHSIPIMEYHPFDSLHQPLFERPNRNRLIGEFPGADGIKTGTIPESGHHLLASAERNGTRFIAIVMGIQNNDYAHSREQCALEAEILLNWAFTHYETVETQWDTRSIPVRGGTVGSVEIAPASLPVFLTIERSGEVLYVLEHPTKLRAPVHQGDVVGHISWYENGDFLTTRELIASQTVKSRWISYPIFRRLRP